MEGFFVLLVLLVIGALVCGPIALVIAIVAMNKANRHEVMLERGLREKKAGAGVKAAEVPPALRASERTKILEEIAEQRPHREPAAAPVFEKPLSPPPMPAKVKPVAPEQAEAKPAAAGVQEAKEAIAAVRDSLEQRIGTRWVLIAGVVTVILAVAFFLKYAYENALIPPLGRVLIVAISGLIALAIGEVTRRRGYDIVAKAVTALGFAILYAADFAAFRLYHLLPAIPAIGLAAAITAGAMVYAVVLDEIIIAVLSLAGGFLAPLMIPTGENLPHHLFSYCLVLGIGAAFCAFYRKWRAVNVLAFLGTFVLYTAWFEKFFRPQLAAEGRPEQMGIAFGWLAVFFTVYLVLPVLHTLVRKVKALAEDVVLVLANSMVAFYYLWTVLYEHWRAPLAFAAVVLGAAHLVMAAVVTLRCREDVNLRAVLLVIGLLFVTVAVPLYFEQDAVVLAWGIEGFVLAVVGCRYRNYLFQLGSAAALVLAIGRLVLNLPMHTAAFTPVFNPAFGTWCFVATVLVLCHLLYRRNTDINDKVWRPAAQIFYAAGVGLLALASALEWYWHCDYNLDTGPEEGFFRGMLMILAALYLLLAARPLRPVGLINPVLAAVVGGAGSVYAAVAMTADYANLNLIASAVFIGGLFAAGWMLNRAAKHEAGCEPVGACFAFGAIAILLVILTEQIRPYWNLPEPAGGYVPVFNPEFGTWCFAAAVVILCHLLYRRSGDIPAKVARPVSQVLYAVTLALLAFASAAEWRRHCDYNLGVGVRDGVFVSGMLMIFAAFYLLLMARPLRPVGLLNPILAAVAAIVGSVYAVGEMAISYDEPFVIFANVQFAAAVVFVGGLFAAVWLFRRASAQEPECGLLGTCFALGAIVLLWMIVSEQIYLYYEKLGSVNWRFLANMWMSVAWAVYGAVLMVVGFWRNVRVLRYMALGLFGLLLAKIFIIDMSTVRSIYRMTAFLATGLTLVAVSYLYQFLKKQGFFEKMLVEPARKDSQETN